MPKFPIGQTVNEFLEDRSIRHATQLERFASGEVHRILGFFKERIEPDLLGIIEKRLQNISSRGFDTGPFTTQRVQDMFRAIDKSVSSGFTDLGAILRKDLVALGVTEAEFQANLLRFSTGPLELEFAVPPRGLVSSVLTRRPFQGKLLREWWGRVDQTSRDLIRQNLQIGLVQGETIDQMVRRIRGTAATGFGNGTLAQIRRNIESVVRTATNHVTNHARMVTWQENKDLVKEWRFVATLDARTTDICAANDGRTWPVGEGEVPPLHIRCRSTTSPVLKSWKELGIDLPEAPTGTRASMDGQVPGKTNFGDWFKSLEDRKGGRAIQNRLFGKGRVELLRSGKITVRDLVDQRNRPLTLKQLRAKAGIDLE
jgi:SPP1 gp7 family putative phage head morphogenesis protein